MSTRLGTLVFSRRFAVLLGILLAAAVVYVLDSPWKQSGNPSEAARSRTGHRSIVTSAHHFIRRSTYAGQVPAGSPIDVTGGGLVELPEAGRFLLARGDGTIFRLRWNGDTLDVNPLPLRAPLNLERFASDVDESIRLEWFRVADILVERRTDTLELLASHHYWYPDDACFVLRLSRIALPLPLEEVGERPDADWSTVHETEPCLPLKEQGRNRFAGHQVGGRLAWWASDRLLLTVGDHEFDGVNADRTVSQDLQSDYGKTLLIDTETGESEIFSLGHRNPQGLDVGSDGRVWATEHGPQGGDELNMLVRGANYGWPLQSLGTSYGMLEWPLESNDPSEDFEEPIYAWLPSIGVSSLLSVEGTRFPRWRGDLLVGSLKDRAIWRLRTSGERIIFAERIDIGERIRDLAEGHDGEILLWTDASTLVKLEPFDDLEEGSGLFLVYCSSCHKLGTARNTFAPDILGVVGQPIASREDFDYSRTLRAMEGRWTEERLREFLSDPQGFAPGTSMNFAGVADSSDVQAIIDYLKRMERASGAE